MGMSDFYAGRDEVMPRGATAGLRYPASAMAALDK